MVGFWWGLSTWLADGHLLTVSSNGLSSVSARGERGLSSSSCKATDPIMRASLSWHNLTLITSPKSHLQIPSHWELGFQCMNFRSREGDTNIQSITNTDSVFFNEIFLILQNWLFLDFTPCYNALYIFLCERHTNTNIVFYFYCKCLSLSLAWVP